MDYPREVACLILQMKAYMSSGEAAKAKRLANQSVKLAREKCSQEVLADTMIEAGYLHQQYLEYAKAEDCTTEALIIARDESLPELEADALTQAAALDSIRNNHKEALLYLREALKVTERTDNRRPRLETILQQGQVYGVLGDYERAMERYEEVETHSSEYPDLLVECLLCQGDVFRSAGDFDKAERLYDLALTESEERDIQIKTAEVLKRVGNILLHKRDFKKALEWFRFCETQTKKFRASASFPFVPLGFGSTYNGLGEYQRAVDCFRRVLDHISPDYLLNAGILCQTLEQLGLSLDRLNRPETGERASDLARRVRDLSRTGVDNSTQTALMAKKLEKELGEFVKSLKTERISVFSRHGVRVDLETGDIYGERGLQAERLTELQCEIFRLLVKQEGQTVSNDRIIGLYEKSVGALEGVPRRAHYFIAEIRRRLGNKSIIRTVRGQGYMIPRL